MNKIYKLIIYILLGLAISITLYSIYLVNIEFILRGFIHIIFLTSLLLLGKLDGKNKKIVEICNKLLYQNKIIFLLFIVFYLFYNLVYTIYKFY